MGPLLKIKDTKFNFVKVNVFSLCKSTKTLISTSDNQKFCFEKSCAKEMVKKITQNKLIFKKWILPLELIVPCKMVNESVILLSFVVHSKVQQKFSNAPHQKSLRSTSLKTFCLIDFCRPFM